MALYIGQKRNGDYSNIASSIESSLSKTIKARNPFYNNEQQEQKCFQDTGVILSQGNFSVAQVYYLTFRLKRINTPISFSIRLQEAGNQTDSEARCQVVKRNCVLPQRLKNKNEYSYFDLVFSPDRNTYNTIVFSIVRQAYDELQKGFIVDGIKYPRSFQDVEPEDYKLYYLNNLREDGQYWKKIGIQARPGSLIVINKQPIRIGRSGIYELNNGTKITSFMIASGLDISGNTSIENSDPFLVDYVYSAENKSNESGG